MSSVAAVAVLGGMIAIWLACGVISAAMAARRGRSAFGWFFGGLILGLVAVILLAVLGNAPGTRSCARCGRAFNRTRVTCPFCRYENPATAETSWQPAPAQAPEAVADPVPPSPAMLLAQLSDLHQAGHITNAEYDAKRAELLDRF